MYKNVDRISDSLECSEINENENYAIYIIVFSLLIKA